MELKELRVFWRRGSHNEKSYIWLKGQNLEIMEVKNNKQSITFSAFTEQQARELLGIKEEIQENLLQGWEDRADKMMVTEDDQKLINRLHAKLKLYVRSWNEEDLKIKFRARHFHTLPPRPPYEIAQDKHTGSLAARRGDEHKQDKSTADGCEKDQCC